MSTATFNRPKADDITTFLGQMSAEEYDLRRRIRTCRNAASFKASRAIGPNARTIYWMATEMAAIWVYQAGVSVHDLEQVKDHLAMLLECAWMAEKLHADLGDAL